MNIAVNRANRKSAVLSYHQSKEKLQDGWHVVIFPEGTIPDHNPVMKSFKNGAFKLAVELQVPILPLTFLNHWKLFADPSMIFGPAQPGLAKVVMHDFIETKGKNETDINDLRRHCFEIIEKDLKIYNSKMFKKLENHAN